VGTVIKNANPHLTAKERDKPSFPTRFLLKNNFLKGSILDFGSGLGKDTAYLKEKSFNVDGYDPFYLPQYPEKKYDTIICNYVLNVLQPEEQTEVLMNVSELLKPDGAAYFTVRRDLKYTGFRLHKLHKEYTYQCNVVLPYSSVFKNENCEIYRYKHFNKHEIKSECPFCSLSDEAELLTESATAYSILDKFPVSSGHALIIPKVHKQSYFDLSLKEQHACIILLNRTKKIIEKRFAPDGFNIGVNINETAGQTIPHVHIHLIPRYKNDVENPVGGVRNVIPGMGEY
jgi:diadenosine tetraphosphate (Ap4A) HIT family hydrolase